MSEKILAMVLAGGDGTRLHPLTLDYAKPSIVFGDCRLVDFVLSNLINSGIQSIYLLTQYKPESLIEHVHANWTFAPNDEGRFISIVAPQPDEDGCSHGSADAIYQNLDLIERHAPDMVAVFAADQIYRIDVRQMVDYHRARKADVTLAATLVPLDQAVGLEVIEAGEDGKINQLQKGVENLVMAQPFSQPVYASTGNCLFNTDVLVGGLEQVLRCDESNLDRHLLPRLVRSHRVFSYDLASNKVPGIQPYEERAYWRNIATLEAYVDALEDVNGVVPRFNVHNPAWPLLPALAAQRPLFDVKYAQVAAAGKRRRPGEMSTLLWVE